MHIQIYNTQTGRIETDNHLLLLVDSGFDAQSKFENVAVQADGTLIVCDACGNFGYLPDHYELLVKLV